MGKEYRLLGPPGTGKTRRLTRVIEATADKHGAERVLVTSFTRAAAQVIAGRTSLPADRVGTLHAHCYRALGSPELADERLDEFNDSVRHDPAYCVRAKAGDMDAPHDGADGQTKAGDDLAARAQVLRARMVPESQWPADVLEWFGKWRGWLQDTGYLDFTSLLEIGLRDIPHAPGSPAVIFGDEAQDWSPLEFALFRKWASRAELGCYIAGDTAQTIYTFKGATPSLFFDPPIPEENYEHLRQSHRMPRAVHAKAERWLLRSCDVSVYRGRSFQPRDVDGYLHQASGSGSGAGVYSSRYPDEIVSQAALDSRANGNTWMILASCEYLLAPTLAVLRARGIPFHNPYRAACSAWNPMRGGVQKLRAFLEAMRPELFFAEAALCQIPSRLWTWQELGKWVEICDGKRVLTENGKRYVEARIRDDSKRKVAEPVTDADLEHIFQPKPLADMMHALRFSDSPWSWLIGAVDRNKAASMAYGFAMVNRYGAAVLREKPRIIVGTIHSVKGGEADNVIVFPDLSRAAFNQWNGKPAMRDSVRRTFYVGMTRARHGLYLAGASSNMAVDWNQ